MNHPALLVALLCALAVTAHAQFPNLVQNPGFERLDDDGVPLNWGADMNVYTPVTEPVRSGSRALQWENDDPDRYVLCGQTIPLEPGKSYECSVWVKTEDVQGDDTGATICLEWWAEDGSYLGGSDPAGIKGTSDWRQVRGVSGRVPEKAARCNVTVYVRKGMTGKAWFDDVVVRRWRGPLLQTTLLTPNYRGQVTPDVPFIEVAADLNLGDWDLRPEDIALRAHVLRREDGGAVRSAHVTPDGSQARISIPTRGLPEGAYDLRVSAARRVSGRELAADGWRLVVVGKREAAARRSYIDRHNRLIREGKPFFPLGMYWSGINEDDIKVYADSAFNCLMPYGTPSQQQMDLAHEHGLKVIYSVKDIYYGSTYCPPGIETVEDERKFIEGKAEAFRDHPALLGWYLNDELPLAFMDRLEAHQAWLEELDPHHPTWVVLYQVGQLEHYRRTFDVIGTDPYPIPGRPASLAGDWTRRTVDAYGGSRPVWMVPQVFNWATYRKTEEEKEGLRPPTLAEMRSMAWQCITEGANGLIFYSFFDLKRDTVVPFEEQWGYVKEMAAEVSELIPVILSVEPTPSFEAPELHWLRWTVRQVGGTTYLIAVNDGDMTRRTRFKLNAEPRSVRLRGSEEAVALRVGDRLPVEFEPFGVRVYEIRF